MATNWWDTCKNGGCTPYNPNPNGTGQGYGLGGYRSDESVPLPVGTPVQSPVNGLVLPQHTTGGGYYSAYGQQSFGGEVDVATVVPVYDPGGRFHTPSRVINVGIIHLDTASVQPGQWVRQGDIIGTSGGQKTGGNWPSGNSSSGPHIGLQIHKIDSWDALLDPSLLMTELQGGNAISTFPTDQQLKGANLNGIATGPSPQPGMFQSTPGTCAPWDIGCLIKNLIPGIVGATKVVIGVGIIFLATLITFLPEVGAGVAIASGVPEAAPAVSQALGGRRRLPQTRIGAGVQAVSIFQAHKQMQQRQGRANAATPPGQQVPFPAGPNAPGQPPLKQRGGRRRGAGAGNPVGGAVGGGVPGGGAGGGGRGKAKQAGPVGAAGPARPGKVPKAAPSPAPAPAPTPAPAAGPRITQPLPIIVPGPKTGLSPLGSFLPKGAGRMRPSTGGSAPSAPPSEPYRGHGWEGATPPVPRAPKPTPAAGEPPMPTPSVPPAPTPEPAPKPQRKQPVSGREYFGAPSRVGAGRGRGPRGARRTPTPRGLTFEQALERVRQQVRVQPATRLPSGIETARPEDTGVNLRDLSKAWKQAPREGQTWSDFMREK